VASCSLSSLDEKDSIIALLPLPLLPPSARDKLLTPTTHAPNIILPPLPNPTSSLDDVLLALLADARRLFIVVESNDNPIGATGGGLLAALLGLKFTDTTTTFVSGSIVVVGEEDVDDDVLDDGVEGVEGGVDETIDEVSVMTRSTFFFFSSPKVDTVDAHLIQFSRGSSALLALDLLCYTHARGLVQPCVVHLTNCFRSKSVDHFFFIRFFFKPLRHTISIFSSQFFFSLSLLQIRFVQKIYSFRTRS
jgi:hypothetical protein